MSHYHCHCLTTIYDIQYIAHFYSRTNYSSIIQIVIGQIQLTFSSLSRYSIHFHHKTESMLSKNPFNMSRSRIHCSECTCRFAGVNMPCSPCSLNISGNLYFPSHFLPRLPTTCSSISVAKLSHSIGIMSLHQT